MEKLSDDDEDSIFKLTGNKILHVKASSEKKKQFV